MRVRATEDAIVRLLKQGHPLPAATIHQEEDVRLPVFAAIEALGVQEYGVEGQARIVVGRARKEVWAVDIKRRSVPVTMVEVEAFLQIIQAVNERHTSQEVTGWMVTTADYESDAAAALAAAGCMYTARAIKR